MRWSRRLCQSGPTRPPAPQPSVSQEDPLSRGLPPCRYCTLSCREAHKRRLEFHVLQCEALVRFDRLSAHRAGPTCHRYIIASKALSGLYHNFLKIRNAKRKSLDKCSLPGPALFGGAVKITCVNADLLLYFRGRMLKMIDLAELSQQVSPMKWRSGEV
jgi:hypothetical protein